MALPCVQSAAFLRSVYRGVPIASREIAAMMGITPKRSLDRLKNAQSDGACALPWQSRLGAGHELTEPATIDATIPAASHPSRPHRVLL